MLLNCAQLVVLIVSRLYWSSADCRSQNWICMRQVNALVDWIFIADPRSFKKPCRPATCVAENFRFGKVKVVAGIHAVCCHEWRLNVAVSNCRSVLLESGGELPRGVPCVITGIVLALGFVLLFDILGYMDCRYCPTNKLAHHFVMTAGWFLSQIFGRSW